MALHPDDETERMRGKAREQTKQNVEIEERPKQGPDTTG